MFAPFNVYDPSVYSVLGSRIARSPQGKVQDLRVELNSGGKKDKNHSAKKIALKKIVANMTMSNNDMVALFPDIVGCMQIPSLEIKKMLDDEDNPERAHGDTDGRAGVSYISSTIRASSRMLH